MCGQCMMCFCSDPMSNTLGIHMHNLATIYNYALYTYAAGYIFNLMLKPYLRHMQMCNDNLFHGQCMHIRG